MRYPTLNYVAVTADYLPEWLEQAAPNSELQGHAFDESHEGEIIVFKIERVKVIGRKNLN